MTKYRGKVMSINHDAMVVMSDTGQFHRVKTFGEERIGQTILYTTYDVVKKPRFSLKKIFSISAVPVMVLALMLFLLPLQNPAYALMTVDINPSIGLYVDAEGIIKKTVSYNEDGQQILDAIDRLKGKTLYESVGLIVKEAENQSFITPEKPEVLITGTLINDVKDLTMASLIDESVAAIENQALETDLVIYEFEGNKEDVKEANDKGISLGKYEVAKASGETLETVKGQTISEMAKEISEMAKAKSRVIKKEKETDREKEKEKEKEIEKDKDKEKGKDEDETNESDESSQEDQGLSDESSVDPEDSVQEETSKEKEDKSNKNVDKTPQNEKETQDSNGQSNKDKSKDNSSHQKDDTIDNDDKSETNGDKDKTINDEQDADQEDDANEPPSNVNKDKSDKNSDDKNNSNSSKDKDNNTGSNGKGND